MSTLAALPKRQVILTFGGVLLAIFLSALDQTIVATALPNIVADLGGFAHYTLITGLPHQLHGVYPHHRPPHRYLRP